MAEQTDWHERGCSRSCRYEHKKVWGWCDLAEEPKAELNLHLAWQRTASDGNVSVGYRRATVEEAEAELAKFRPEPTWREVFRVMRAESVRMRRFVNFSGSADRNAWKLWDLYDNELGCIVRETGYGREEWTVSFTYERGPAASMSATSLRPVDVLNLARISGVVGGVS